MFHRRSLRLHRAVKKTEQDATTVLPLRAWKRPPDSSRFSRWTKFLLPIVPSIVFGVFTIVFNIQQHSFFHETRQREQYQIDAQNQRLIFDNYIDIISERLLNAQFLRNNSEHLLTIRVKTLTALRHLNAHYKREIILFLYDNKFLRTDLPKEEQLDLKGADLSSVQFASSSTYRCTLNNLYLPDVFGYNIVFHGCKLKNSIFDRSDLNESQFIDCSLDMSRFVDSSLNRAEFHSSDLDGVNFAGAVLKNTKFFTTFFQNVTLKNTDLLGSQILDTDLIASTPGRKPNILWNTRFPNGSFSKTDSTQLVKDGGAEIECSSDNGVSSWGNISGNQRWQCYKEKSNQTDKHSIQLPDPVEGSCYFVTNVNSLVFQHIIVNDYSLLIDNDQACCNVSAYMGCSQAHPNDQVTITVRFINSRNLSYAAKSLVKTSRATPFQYDTNTSSIPKDTRMISVRYGAAMQDSVISNASRYCAIDDIRVFIFGRKNKTMKCSS